MKIKGVIFDIDGTLLDSLTLIKEAWNVTTEKHLGWKFPPNELSSRVGLPLRSQLVELDSSQADAMEKTYRDFQKNNHDQLVTLYPGVKDFIKSLSKRGILLGVATSKAKVGMDLSKPLFGDDTPIKTWITVDDVTHHKPHPEALLLASSKLGLAPNDCAYVGDSIYDDQAARAAGMISISVGWGVTDLEKLGGDFKVNSISELEKLLTSSVS